MTVMDKIEDGKPAQPEAAYEARGLSHEARARVFVGWIMTTEALPMLVRAFRAVERDALLAKIKAGHGTRTKASREKAPAAKFFTVASFPSNEVLVVKQHDDLDKAAHELGSWKDCIQDAEEEDEEYDLLLFKGEQLSVKVEVEKIATVKIGNVKVEAKEETK